MCREASLRKKNRMEQLLERKRLEDLLAKIKNVKAVLIGDMCLDVYWFADMTQSVLSRETPHFPLPVVEEKMSAGAGGNAAVNMSVLCDSFTPVGIVGRDWRGVCLMDVLKKQGINTDYLVAVDDRVTNAYCKPMRRGFSAEVMEDPRLDFESFAPLSKEAEDALLQKLNEATKGADLLCVSDQFASGCITPKIRERINELAKGGLLTVVDSRSKIGLYKNCILKPNEIECARALGLESDALCREKATEADVKNAAVALSEKTESDICLTLGDRGSLVYRKGEFTPISAIKLSPPFDIVGAGDCFLSAFSLALAAGAETAEAGKIGSLASGVCVKKLHTTGSASREEILALYDKAAN